MKSNNLLAIAAFTFLGAGAVLAAPTFVEVGGTTFGNTVSAGGNMITQDTTWTRDKVYILRRVVYVLPPAKLTIEPGTIIRGVPTGLGFETGGANEPGTLVVARGAKIEANGTPDDPIIMTSLTDPHVPGGTATIPASVNGVSTAAYASTRNYAPDGPGSPTVFPTTGLKTNAFAIDGEWGGLVLLGDAPIGYDADVDTNFLTYDPVTDTFNTAVEQIAYTNSASNSVPSANDVKGGNGVGIALIEGLNLNSVNFGSLPGTSYTYPWTSGDVQSGRGETTAAFQPMLYGGENENSDSGVLRFISNRFGGFPLGTNIEINGLTMGGVGRGTVVEWQEVYNNKDDGFEWFGGMVNSRYLFSLFNGDDGLDGDTGYSGNIQSAFVIADNGGIARSGWPSNNNFSGRIAGDSSDTLIEWDGSEDQGVGVTPETRQWMRNMTLMGSDTSSRKRPGMLLRRGNQGNIANSLVQDLVGSPKAADIQSPASPTLAGMVYSNVTYSDKIGAAVDTPTVQTVGKGHVVKNGLDPRLSAGADAAAISNSHLPAARGGDFPFAGWSPLPFRAAMRDNNMLKGWTMAERLQILGTTNVTRPALSLTANGSGQAVINFDAAAGIGGRAVVYVVESSVDGKVWTPMAVVQDNNADGIGPVSGHVSTDSNATTGKISVVDTVNPALTAGSPRQYRVIPQ